ncbi:MAG: hypothetical protein QW505_00715 [Thermoplasmata archaeon]
MPRITEEWGEPGQQILREALRLGFEVGFRGQIEDNDWVKVRYRELESEASRLGIIDDLIEKYEAGKAFGKKRRLSSAISADGGFVFQKKRGDLRPERQIHPGRERPKPRLPSDMMPHRVSPKEAIEVLSEMIRLAEKSDKLRERIESAFACLADAHDRLSQLLQSHGDSAEILVEGLQILNDLGWIHAFDLIEIDSSKNCAMIDVESLIAQCVGQASGPMCRPLSIALETIGLRAFGVPIAVVEKRCISQGAGKCRFVLSPRILG